MDKLVRINVIMKESLYKKLQKLANENKTKYAARGNVSRQIRHILEEYGKES